MMHGFLRSMDWITRIRELENDGGSALPPRMYCHSPFTPHHRDSILLAVPAQVTLNAFNLLGEEVATLVNEVQGAGVHRVAWRAEGMARGVYFYALMIGWLVERKKLVLLK